METMHEEQTRNQFGLPELINHRLARRSRVIEISIIRSNAESCIASNVSTSSCACARAFTSLLESSALTTFLDLSQAARISRF